VSILLTASELTHGFGARPLFEEIGFTLSEGDRVGLIGPNGAGKSTVLKILAGALAPDHGNVARRNGLRVGYLPQTPTFAAGATVREALRAALPAGAADADWEQEALVEQTLSRLHLPDDGLQPESPVAQLSGGWQKRIALQRALLGAPDLLLLDEPTNHLDIDSILRLEATLAEARFALVLVTHDRAFLQRIATRILELDRRNAGGLLDVAGDYATYTEQKVAVMAAQERREEVLRNTLRRETEWLRRGPAARTTKQQARIQRAATLSDEVAELGGRNRDRALAVDFQGQGQKPRRLIEGRGLGHRYGDRLVFQNLDLTVTPGTRLCLLGPNGCGKSTLLRVLLGEEAPSEGRVTRADSLRVGTFEQDRGSLDPSLSVADTVCPDGDYVDFRGARQHRHGYLERFLFTGEQMNVPVGRLSGGEQARLLVARLMLRPANVLVLDEPTNDLDLPTLTVLEEALTSFDGAVLLVTHDRYFLDQVATQILAFHSRPDERGQVTSFSSLGQWELWYPSQTARERPSRGGGPSAGQPGESRGDAGGSAAGVSSREVWNPLRVPGQNKTRRKLGFREQREWETMEGKITAAESRLRDLEAESTRPEVAVDAARLVTLLAEIEAARAEVDRLYTRWAELEALAAP
jgi:ABC transport system ATP-binding/permease protein